MLRRLHRSHKVRMEIGYNYIWYVHRGRDDDQVEKLLYKDWSACVNGVVDKFPVGFKTDLRCTFT